MLSHDIHRGNSWNVTRCVRDRVLVLLGEGVLVPGRAVPHAAVGLDERELVTAEAAADQLQLVMHGGGDLPEIARRGEIPATIPTHEPDDCCGATCWSGWSSQIHCWVSVTVMPSRV